MGEWFKNGPGQIAAPKRTILELQSRVTALEAKVRELTEEAIEAHAEAERRRVPAEDYPVWKARAEEKQQRVIALEAENARLREIAGELDDALGEDDDEYPDDTPMTVKYGRTTLYALKLGLLRRARALLQGGPDAG